MKKLLLCLLPLLTCCSKPPSSAQSELPGGDTLAQKGRLLFTQTYELLPHTVQAKLNCNSCHLDGGRAAGAFALVGVAKSYPKFDVRVGAKLSLPQRINECFTRSLNGYPVAEDGPEMRALLAYLEDLQPVPGQPVPASGIRELAAPPKPADGKRGAGVYEQKCAECHQANGAGQYVDDLPLFPALWGDKSYNSGAGLDLPKDLAAFVHSKMPLGRSRAISNQEAWDVATFINSQPRPAYSGKAKNAQQ